MRYFATEYKWQRAKNTHKQPAKRHRNKGLFSIKILIFGLFGFPKLEVAGAAIATVVGQVVAAIGAIIFNAEFC